MAEIGNKEIRTNYPIVQGIEADEKHDGVNNSLEVQEKSLVPNRLKVGLN